MLNSKDLSVLSYANGFTLWHFTTTDAAHDVTAAGYFNSVTHMLRKGDMIVSNLDADAPLPSGALLLVAANEAGTVVVTDLTGLGAGSQAQAAE